MTVILNLKSFRLDDKVISKVNVGSVSRFKHWDVVPGDQMAIALAGQGIPRLEEVTWRVVDRTEVSLPEPNRYNALSCMMPEQGCMQQFLSRLIWLSGPEALDMAGFGGATWQKLLGAWPGDTLTSWLSFNEKDLAAVSGIGVKQAQKLMVQIHLARQKDFRHWLSAIGFPSFALKFAGQQQSWSRLIQMTSRDWEMTEGVGKKRAAQIYEFIHHPHVLAVIDALKQGQLPAFL